MRKRRRKVREFLSEKLRKEWKSNGFHLLHKLDRDSRNREYAITVIDKELRDLQFRQYDDHMNEVYCNDAYYEEQIEFRHYMISYHMAMIAFNNELKSRLSSIRYDLDGSKYIEPHRLPGFDMLVKDYQQSEILFSTRKRKLQTA